MVLIWVIIILSLFALNKSQATRVEGDDCTLPDKNLGVCKLPENCSDENKLSGEICGFKGMTPIVCCSKMKPVKLKTLRSSEEFCAKNHVRTNDDVDAVFGGYRSVAGQFPHMAILGYGKKEDIKWGCGGSLISFRHILTAAHCINTIQLGEVKFVRLGDLNLTSNSDLSEPQDFTIVKRTKHPDYFLPSKYHDIAIIELDRDVKKSSYVTPTCLPISDFIATSTLIATGWGRLEFAGASSDHLMVVYLNYIDNKKCNEKYSSETKSKLPCGIIEDWQICAGKHKADTCQGDSGGPLQVVSLKYENCFHVVGVTSFGKACGISDAPGVYTRVYNYLDWIESIVWPAA